MMQQLAPLPRARIGARAVYRVILCPDCAADHIALSPQVVYERVTGENPTPYCHGCGAEIEEPEHDTSDRPRPRARPPPAPRRGRSAPRPGVIHNRQNFRRAPRGFTQRNAVRVGGSENENDERGVPGEPTRRARYGTHMLVSPQQNRARYGSYRADTSCQSQYTLSPERRPCQSRP